MDINKFIKGLINHGANEEVLSKILAGLLSKKVTQDALTKIFSDLIGREDVQNAISNGIAKYLVSNFGEKDTKRD